VYALRVNLNNPKFKQTILGTKMFVVAAALFLFNYKELETT
jgi:hypothetical protein